MQNSNVFSIRFSCIISKNVFFFFFFNTWNYKAVAYRLDARHDYISISFVFYFKDCIE